MELLAKLSTADMVALEAKYHTKCLIDFYNRARKANANRCKGIDEMEVISKIVFVELVLYIEEVGHHDVERAAVFVYNTKRATWDQARYEAVYNKAQTKFVS